MSEADSQGGALILLAEDDALLRQVLVAALEGEGYRVEQARHGDEVLWKAEQRQPDLIVLDLLLPGMGGLEVLAHLEKHATLKGVPVLTISGAPHLLDQARRHRGGTPTLQKPFDMAELVGAVGRLLRGRAG